jgi:hypothetical protein
LPGMGLGRRRRTSQGDMIQGRDQKVDKGRNQSQGPADAKRDGEPNPEADEGATPPGLVTGESGAANDTGMEPAPRGNTTRFARLGPAGALTRQSCCHGRAVTVGVNACIYEPPATKTVTTRRTLAY